MDLPAGIHVHKIMDGTKNCAAQVWALPGRETSWFIAVPLAMFVNPVPKKVKLDHVEWAITSGLEVLLAWHSGGEERDLILPLGGRGSMNFSDYGGLSNTEEGRSGHIEMMVQQILDHPRCVQSFSLFLDLIKQE